MDRLPRITGRKLIQVLQKEGFEIARQKGSHVQVRKFVMGKKNNVSCASA
jgi:predicted RNA binding protein YcfA (HicA-like mRNA interferase family)